MSAVVFLSGASMGDALGASGRSLRGIFERMGHQFIEINLTKSDGLGQLNQTITTTPVEFVLSHVGMAIDLTGRGGDQKEINFWTGSGIPFISFFGDSPAYFFDRHVMPGAGFACLYAFPEHYHFRRSLPKRKGILGVTPLVLIDDTPKVDIDFRRKETGKLLFLKNGNDPQRLISIWRDTLPLNLFVMLTDLSSHLLARINSSDPCDIDATVCSYFSDRDIDIEALVSLRLLFVAQLDDYLRRVKSTTIAETLRKFPVEVHGYNWEHVDFSGYRARYFYGGDYTATRHLIAGALGIIDMSPNTSLRPHDRVLRAFGLHTLCLTNDQQFFRQHFSTYRDFTFAFDAESLEAKVSEVLTNPRRFIELGVAVAEDFRKQFDKEQFGRTILEIASCLRTVMRPRPAGMQDFFVWPPTKLG